MNASGSSFKAQTESVSDIKAAAHQEMDKLSMGSSRAAAKKKTAAPRTLKPLVGKPGPKPKGA